MTCATLGRRLPTGACQASQAESQLIRHFVVNREVYLHNYAHCKVKIDRCSVPRCLRRCLQRQSGVLRCELNQPCYYFC